jgi:hypothetical protein
MAEIKEQKLIYHLTAIENLFSILDRGLLPRAQLKGFADVADMEILQGRQKLGLEHCVPFHFFARNPFDGRVKQGHPNIKFALIAVKRSAARQLSWSVIPRHPLAGGGGIQLMNYDDGFNAINWEKMGQRNYADPECKSICMAECLSPGPVKPDLFSNIFVHNEEIRSKIHRLVVAKGLATYVNVNTSMLK